MMDDDDHPELDFDPLDDTKTWPEERLPAAAGRHDGARPRRRRTSSPRTSRSRSAPACWSTGWTSPTTRCSSGGRSPTRDTQRYRVGPNYLQLPVNQPKNAAVAHQPARRRRWPTTSTADRREPARQLRAVDHRRPAARRRSPRTTSRARRSAGALTRERIPRTNDYQPGRRALPARPSSGRRTTSSRNLVDAAGPVRPADPGAHGLAPASCARTSSGQRVGDGLGITADDVRAPQAARDADADARPSSSASTTSATTARATSRGSS